MTQPSEKAMQAARAINYFVRGSEDLDIDYTNVAETLDRFAADAVREAVAAERDACAAVCYQLMLHHNERFGIYGAAQDKAAFGAVEKCHDRIRARSKP